MNPARIKHILFKERVVFLLIAFFLLRLYRLQGQTATHWVDTAGYLKLDFSGHGARLWPVPLIYELIESDTQRIVFHVVFAALAWGFCATVIAVFARKFSMEAAFGVLLLGSADQVSLWDTSLLSESIGTSLIVLTVAAAIWVIHERNYWSVGMLCVVGSVTAMTRPPQVPLLFFLVALLLWVSIRGRNWRYALFLVALVPLATWAVQMVRNNRPTSELNFYMMLDERIMHNEARRDWFVANGMPVTEEIIEATGFGDRADVTAELYEFMPLPEGQPPNAIMIAGGIELAKWVRESGWSTYSKFLLTHPNDAVKIATDQNYATLNAGPYDLLPTNAVMLLPDWLWGGWQWFAIPSITLAAVLGLTRRLDRSLVKMLLAMLVCVPWFFLVVHAAGMEHPRHAFGVAVTVRLFGFAFIVYAVERLVELRRSTKEPHDQLA